MAVFPELISSTRTYSPGGFPHSVHRGYQGSEARVRHSNTVLSVRLRLFFPAITSAELLTVISHYAGQRGRFLPFAIPQELLSGAEAPADFTPAGHQWRYAAKPTVEDISVDGGTNLHDLTVELETVPPENTIVQGARLRARSILRAGSAQLGEFLDVFTSLDAGAAYTQLDLSAVAYLDAGSPFPVVGFDVVATLTAGEFIPPTPGELLVTASLAAGAASGGTSDPEFANVSLLLPFDGADGSTAFTDESNNAYAVVAFGNAQLDTGQSKWGGSSLLLDGSGDYAAIASPPANLRNWWDDTYQIDAWVYLNSYTERTSAITSLMVGHMAPTANVVWWSFGPIAAQAGAIKFQYFNGGPEGFQTTTLVPLSTWTHLRFTHSGGTARIFIAGTLEATHTVSGTPQSRVDEPLCIGAAQSYWFDGQIDDLRIQKGGTVSTASFTPPTGPFPTS